MYIYNILRDVIICNWLTNEWKSWSFMMSHWFWQSWWVCKRFVLVGLDFKNRWHCAHCKWSALFAFQMILPSADLHRTLQHSWPFKDSNGDRAGRIQRTSKRVACSTSAAARKKSTEAPQISIVHSPCRLGKPKIPIGSASCVTKLDTPVL